MDLHSHYRDWSGMVIFRLVLLTVTCVHRVQAGLLESLEIPEPKEYCQTDVFQAHCGPNETILMQSAFYGRMRVGRCVTMDLGYVGCSKDVLSLADSMCSGKPKCEIAVPHKDFDKTKPCLQELKSYLEASYTCVPVQTVDTEQCPELDTVNLTATEGVISSATSVYSLCGTKSHPWLITSQPGQRINITLYDLAVEPDFQSSSGRGRVTLCKEYGFVEEYESEMDRVATICGGRQRVSHVLLSEGNAVKIWFEHMRVKKKMDHFLIEYQVVGCPNVVPPENTWFKRVEGGGAEMGCIFTDTKWTMDCEGYTWVGTPGNCSKPHHEEISNSGKDKMTISYGEAVAIILGAAFGVGFFIVIIGLVRYRQRRRNNRRHSCSREAMLLRPKSEDMSKPSTSHQGSSSQQQCAQTAEEAAKAATYALAAQAAARQARPLRINGNEYEHIWESPLPTPRGSGSNTLPRRCQNSPSTSQPLYTKYKTENKQPREKPLYVTSRDIVAVKEGHFDPARYSSLDRGGRRRSDQ